ncbi:GbsR/MarR family transcriptional regulator [Paenibacillus nasutitermitis]|uniref:HTH-type transcriptional regulator n=1 Tax=Paenibacillus nasutitermitis TaxID=1652958 RepID=A0A917DSQ9_9BACL|nr:hypothetical protein [Paenibacillus nasutitermitis]GGD63122.1 hypothetical protein GCM10010911_21130 [Paenibacillus nasutitermitis]
MINTMEQTTRLTQSTQKFIDKLGLYYESYAIPRIGGKILGLLLIVTEPISAEMITKTLKVSRSSVSTNIRLLLSNGLVDIFQKAQDRTDYFVLSDDTWENALRMRMEGFNELKRIAEQGIQAVDETNLTPNARLKEMIKWTGMMQELHQDAVIKWRSAQLNKEK